MSIQLNSVKLIWLVNSNVSHCDLLVLILNGNYVDIEIKTIKFSPTQSFSGFISISNIGFYFNSGEFCHDFHSIPIPINHSGTHFNLPPISTSLKEVALIFVIQKRLNPMPVDTYQLKGVAIKCLQGCWGPRHEKINGVSN